MGQKYAAYDSTGSIIGFYDSIDSPVPAGVEAIEITDAQWQTCISTPGYTVKSGALVAPVPPTAAQIAAQQSAAAWSVYQASAKAALDASDITILRCYENAVVAPAAWATYRKALRAVVSAASGDATQPLPVAPQYPAGT
jgi:hypothetical protein